MGGDGCTAVQRGLITFLVQQFFLRSNHCDRAHGAGAIDVQLVVGNVNLLELLAQVHRRIHKFLPLEIRALLRDVVPLLRLVIDLLHCVFSESLV